MTLKDKKEKLFADCFKYEQEGDQDKAMFCKYLIFQISARYLEEYEAYKNDRLVNKKE